jgi:hypothetical protein
MRATQGLLCSAVVLSALGCGDSSGPKAGPPANLGVVNQASVDQIAVIGTPTPLPLSVLVTDATNRPVSGAAVTFAVAPGGGTLSTAAATTDANGIASATWTLGPTFGKKTATATVQGLAVVTFTATAIAPDAGVLAFNLVDPSNDTIPPDTDTIEFDRAIDVLSVQGIFKRDSLILTITFASPVAFGSHPNSLAGFVEFDIDDNADTGFGPLSNQYGASANAAVEYALFLDGETGTSIGGVLNIVGNTITPVSASYPGNTIVIHIPMSLLGGDDGNFTIVGVLGSFDRATDFFPNTGAALARRSLGASFTVRSSRSAPILTSPLEQAGWHPTSRDYLQAR